MTVKGNALTTAQEIAGSPEHVIGANGRGIVRKFAVLWSNVESAIPARGTPDNDFPSLLLDEVSYTREGDAAMLSLRYMAPNAMSDGGAGVLIPDDSASIIKQANANAMEIPLRQNPNWSATWEDDTDKLGIEVYLSPRPTYSRTFRTTTFGWTQAEVVLNVGTLVSPPGIVSPTAGRWLKVDRQARDVGIDKDNRTITEITDSYQYNPAGWNSDIYSAGTAET